MGLSLTVCQVEGGGPGLGRDLLGGEAVVLLPEPWVARMEV